MLYRYMNTTILHIQALTSGLKCITSVTSPLPNAVLGVGGQRYKKIFSYVVDIFAQSSSGFGIFLWLAQDDVSPLIHSKAKAL